jgi:hypothetical protein
VVTSNGNDFGDLAGNEAQTSAESSALPTYGAPRGNGAPVATSLQVELPDRPPALETAAALLLWAMIQRAVASARQDAPRRPNA